MAGFRSEIVYATNADFSKANSLNGYIENGLITNGQMWIGTTTPNVGGTQISVGNIISPLGTISVGYTFPNITLDVVGGLVAIETIDGDTGSASGNTINVVTGVSTNNSGSSIEFVGDNTSTLTLNVTDSNDNTMLGKGAGNSSLVGEQNCAFGMNALASSVSDSNNCAVGWNALNGLNGGNQNTAVGTQAMQAGGTSLNNVSIGFESLFSSTSSQYNCVVGYGSLYSLLSGSFNLTLGTSSGNAYSSSESNNIILNHTGIANESNVLRIGSGSGTGTQQLNDAYISGIYSGSPVNANTPQIVLCDNIDNLTVISSSTAGYVLTSNGTNAPSFQSIPVTIFSWIDQSTDTTADANTGYFATAALTLTLPASPSQSDVVSIAVDTTDTIIVQANTGQKIRLGQTISSTSGSATNSFIGDTMNLTYRASDSLWMSISDSGNWSLA